VIWARAAFGDWTAAALGSVAAVSALFSTAAVIAGLCQYLAPALHVPNAARVWFGWGAVGAMATVAAFGLRPSAFAWDALTVLKLVPLVALALVYAVAGRASQGLEVQAPGGWERALLICVFPLQGFEAVPVLAGNARGRHSIAIATLGSLFLAALLYAVIQLACVRALPDLAHQAGPLSAAARALGGPLLETLVSLGTNVSAIATGFGMIVMTPRYLSALGRDGGLGQALGVEDERGVPRLALLISALVIALLASSARLGSLFILSSASVLVQYVGALLSLLVLAVRGGASVPKRAALPAVFGLAAAAFLARGVKAEELPGVGLALLFGLLVTGYARARRRGGGERSG
jgi:amino acid transporter